MAKREHSLLVRTFRFSSFGLLLGVTISLPSMAGAQLLPAFSAPQTPSGISKVSNFQQKQPSQNSHKKIDKKPTPAVRPIPDPQLPPQGVQPRPDGVMPGVRRGSIQDVNAVGDRKIGGRGLGNWYGERGEIEMGQQYAAEIDKSTHFIKDPVVDEYINRIGQNLVKNSDAKVPFIIKVIDSNQINAFALPGGFFYVNSGLILAADNEAELAAVMAHEIAHVAAHHAAREMTRMHYAQLGSVPLIFMGGWAGYGIYEAANLAIPVTFLQFSREFEAQADYLGVQYLYRAGYDPTAMISFFEKIEAPEKQKPGVIARAFDTHPQTPDRIEATEREIAHILPPRSEYLEDTSEFEQVKARLARIENRRKLHAPAKSQRPSLRRASAGAPGSEEPPTLHRPQINGTPD
uniref:Peptidase M48 n=1 Tax=Acidobacterium capsulatum TaxID=33075 RepID=A0A7V4XRH4_9BACT